MRASAIMTVHRKHDVTVIVAFVVCVVIYASFRSELRLRPEMPLEFFNGSRIAPEKRASEEKIAKAYWDCAVKQVQWKYGYAHRLPDEPPPEFLISSHEIGPAANDEAVRQRYWQRLREIWNVPSAWRTRYEWSSVSLRESLRSGGDWWGHLVRSVMG
ncbi:MAG: hypothetical protein JWO91_1396 [Acidobacteriaceae bacterium]|nr:hypothetical protein [Acidobacteriaceae bacterium]